MKKIMGNKNTRLAVQIVVLVVVIGLLWQLPSATSTFTAYLLSKMMIYALFSMSLFMLMGLAGIPSLAQTSIGGVAGYILALGRTEWDWPWLVAALVGILVVLVLAYLFAKFSQNVSTIAFMMMTMCLANLINQCALTWTDVTRGWNGINGVKGPTFFGIKFANSRKFYYIIVLVVPICYYIIKRLSKSPFGMAVQGMRDNSVKAESMGFDTKRIRVVLFVISGFFAAVAGCLMTTFYSQMSPSNLSGSMSLLSMIMLVIGGSMHLEGAFVGAVVYVLLENFVGEITLYYKSILGVLFLACVFLIPDGIVSLPILRGSFWKKRFHRKEVES